MLEYDKQNEVFEITEAAYEEFISQQLQHNLCWNETQLQIIVQTLVNFLNTVFEVYKYYPGNMLDLIQKLAAINQMKQDPNKAFLREMLALRQQLPLEPLKDLIDNDIAKPYQLCIGNLDAFKLNKLQTNYVYTQEQFNALQQIISDILNAVITDIRSSRVYQEAKSKEHLFYNPVELAAYAQDYETFLPSSQVLTQLAERAHNDIVSYQIR